MVRVSRPRWRPRKSRQLVGDRNVGVRINLSKGTPDGPGLIGYIRGWIKTGWSLSFKFFWFTYNTRGRYSINGPGIADYRGTVDWDDDRRESRGNPGGRRGNSRGRSRAGTGGNPARRTSGNPRGRSRTSRRGTPGQSRGWVGIPHAAESRELCGARRDSDGGPCQLPAGHQSRWHEPPPGEEPWRDDV